MASSMILEATPDDLSSRYGATTGERSIGTLCLFREVSAFDHLQYPIIVNSVPQAFQSGYRWGLVPPDWKRAPDDIWNHTYKAKLEYLGKRYAWSKVLANRCLVPATAYFEYHWEDPKGKLKTKYRIESVDETIFSIAGLYSVWQNPEGRQVCTYTICTTTGNEIMKFVHNKDIAKEYYRMPVMLHSSDERNWLDASVPHQEFAYPKYKPRLSATRVSDARNIQTTLFE